jgi:acetyl esterase/lipase
MLSLQARILEVLFTLKKRFADTSGVFDVAKQRAEIESMAGMFRPIGPMQCSSVVANGVPAEWIVPSSAEQGRVVLFLHGGSFLSGSIKSHRTLAGNVAIAARARVLLIGYRLAPEHPFPAALEDATAAWEWLLAEGCAPGATAVAGDSAGGTLALALLVHLRDRGRPLPVAAACSSPAPDLTFPGDSFVFNLKKDLMLEPRMERRAVELYLNGADPRQPLASPSFADLRGLPPLLLQVGSHELFLSDVEEFARKARDAGVDTTLAVWPRMQHEWQFAARVLPEGRRAIDQIGEFLQAAFARASGG